jgi:hypothetical protein
MLDKQIQKNYKICFEMAKSKNKLHSNCVLDSLKRLSWSNSFEELELNTKNCILWIKN